MDIRIYPVLANKFNGICNISEDNLIYSLAPSIDEKPAYMNRIYAHNLSNLPAVLDSALSVFGNKKSDVAKTSYPYIRLNEDKEELLRILGDLRHKLGLKTIKIGDDKITAALAALSHIYFDSFFYPVQFFLPHSSVCSGQWDFWDKINYIRLVEQINQKEPPIFLAEQLSKSGAWKKNFRAEDFPEIVKRRLVKEKLLGKELDSCAMIKAIIIRMGELAKPSINYEVIDFSIRSFFTYLGVKQYIRIDREIKFLRAFEEEISKILISFS